MSTVIVAGIARSGLTVTMQMLHAGGFPCAGEYPAFEPFQIGEIPWSELSGKAVKVVDTQLQFPPKGNYRVIRLNRDLNQQAKSTAKFLWYMAGLNSHWKGYLNAIRRDQKKISKWLERQDQVLNLQFENLIRDPHRIAIDLQAWLQADLDIEKMQSVVMKRVPECTSQFYEARMI